MCTSPLDGQSSHGCGEKNNEFMRACACRADCIRHCLSQQTLPWNPVNVKSRLLLRSQLPGMLMHAARTWILLHSGAGAQNRPVALHFPQFMHDIASNHSTALPVRHGQKRVTASTSWRVPPCLLSPGQLHTADLQAATRCLCSEPWGVRSISVQPAQPRHTIAFTRG